jgi:hypothetical protein
MPPTDNRLCKILMIDMEIRQEVMDWLLDSDPAIRWQVRKDILHEPLESYEKERAQITQAGWCARLLQLQDGDGLWNGSLYNGKWLSTTYSLYLLKILGLSPGNSQALQGCDQLLNRGLYQQEEIRFSSKKDIVDLGVTAIVLSLCCYFGYASEALSQIVMFLARQQCEEGNWFPNESPSVAGYTFETTLLVLEAVLQYQNRYAAEKDTFLILVSQKGQDFLLRNNLGIVNQQLLKKNWSSFSFPPYWFYDILTALDYFRDFRMNKDIRCRVAIDLLSRRQTKDGKWLLGLRHSGKTYFEMEKVGCPSRWNTLRALRVLDWWNSPG